VLKRFLRVALFLLPETVISREQSYQPQWYFRSFPCGSRATEQFLRTARCGKYLTSIEISALLDRRDLILKRYDTLRAEQGVKVLYP
jgi:hypothetical protein